MTRRVVSAQWQGATVFRIRGSQERQIEGHSTRITRLRVMTQIGTTTGTGGVHILTTVTSLSLSTASGTDSTHGITCHTTVTTVIRTIITVTPTITPTITRTTTMTSRPMLVRVSTEVVRP